MSPFSGRSAGAVLREVVDESPQKALRQLAQGGLIDPSPGSAYHCVPPRWRSAVRATIGVGPLRPGGLELTLAGPRCLARPSIRWTWRRTRLASCRPLQQSDGRRRLWRHSRVGRAIGVSSWRRLAHFAPAVVFKTHGPLSSSVCIRRLFSKAVPCWVCNSRLILRAVACGTSQVPSIWRSGARLSLFRPPVSRSTGVWCVSPWFTDRFRRPLRAGGTVRASAPVHEERRGDAAGHRDGRRSECSRWGCSRESWACCTSGSRVAKTGQPVSSYLSIQPTPRSPGKRPPRCPGSPSTGATRRRGRSDSLPRMKRSSWRDGSRRRRSISGGRFPSSRRSGPRPRGAT